MKTPEEIMQNNMKVVEEREGRGGLDYRIRSYVECIDAPNKRVMLGGLGAMGVGKMWFGYEDPAYYKDHPGFEGAPTAEEYEAWQKANPYNFGPCPRKTCST